jgi:hypothetical protein
LPLLTCNVQVDFEAIRDTPPVRSHPAADAPHAPMEVACLQDVPY